MSTPRTLRIAAAAAVTCIAVIATSTSASADTTPTTAPASLSARNTTTTVKPTGATSSTTTLPADPFQRIPGAGQLNARYATLTGALLSFYAQSSGMNLQGYMTSQLSPETLNQLAAPIDTDLSSAQPATLPASLTQLDTSLATPLMRARSADELAGALASSAGGLDTQAVAAGINFASNVGNLPTPSLSMPNLPAGTENIAGAGPESLTFGLFYNQSLAQFMNSAPNLFAQSQQNGILSGQASQAFSQAQASAAAALAQPLSSSLTSPCNAALLGSLSTGSAAVGRSIGGRSCSPCAAAGAYMSGRMTTMLNPQSGSTLQNSNDGVVTASEWDRLPAQQRDALLRANPNLADQVQNERARTSRQGAAASACAESSQGTANYLAGNGTSSSIIGRLAG